MGTGSSKKTGRWVKQEIKPIVITNFEHTSFGLEVQTEYLLKTC
jgi:hypothetical protein